MYEVHRNLISPVVYFCNAYTFCNPCLVPSFLTAHNTSDARPCITRVSWLSHLRSSTTQFRHRLLLSIHFCMTLRYLPFTASPVRSEQLLTVSLSDLTPLPMTPPLPCKLRCIHDVASEPRSSSHPSPSGVLVSTPCRMRHLLSKKSFTSTFRPDFLSLTLFLEDPWPPFLSLLRPTPHTTPSPSRHARPSSLPRRRTTQ